jgi:FixJ family two-component response regulator
VNVSGISRDALGPAVIIVIDDDASVRAAIEDLLGSVELSARTFASPEEFLQSDWVDGPGCIILDVRMPGMSGLDLQHELAAMEIHVPIVFITAHGDVPMAVRAMKAGASDFLTKPFRDQELLDAIHAAIRKDRLRRREEALRDELQQRYALLTVGERQVLGLVVLGRLNKQIAGALGVSEITVKVRRASLMRKLEVTSLPELVQLVNKLDLESSTHRTRGPAAAGDAPYTPV